VKLLVVTVDAVTGCVKLEPM